MEDSFEFITDELPDNLSPEKRIYKHQDAECRVSKETKLIVLARDNNTCQYCGRSDKRIILEHVIPVSFGGHGKEYNIVASCDDCNMKKTRRVVIPNNIDTLRLINPQWADRIIELSNIKFNKKKRNMFTLSPSAQIIMDKIPHKEKSAFISYILEHFKPIVKDGKFSE